MEDQYVTSWFLFKKTRLRLKQSLHPTLPANIHLIPWMGNPLGARTDSAHVRRSPPKLVKVNTTSNLKKVTPQKNIKSIWEPKHAHCSLGPGPKVSHGGHVMALPHGFMYHNPKQNMRSIVDSTSTPGSNDIASPTMALVKSAMMVWGKVEIKCSRKLFETSGPPMRRQMSNLHRNSRFFSICIVEWGTCNTRWIPSLKIAGSLKFCKALTIDGPMLISRIVSTNKNHPHSLVSEN